MTAYQVYDTGSNPTRGRSRIRGDVQGLTTEQWPRHAGRPMQHAFTIDLEGLDLAAPKAKGARLMAVFMDDLRDHETETSEGITVVWIPQSAVDDMPRTAPPPDWVDQGTWLKGINLSIEEAEDELDDDDSFLGHPPIWPEDTEPPAELPKGMFVMQAQGCMFEFSRALTSMMIYEGGAYIVRDYPDEDDDPMRWVDAIAQSSELVVRDEAPAAGALQKVGGIPPVAQSDWPKKMSHVLTIVPGFVHEEDEDDLAGLAVFARLDKSFGHYDRPVPENRAEWDLYAADAEREMDAIRIVFITKDDVEENTEVEPPKGVQVLPEKTLEQRALPAGTTFHDLRTMSFSGPRPAWRDPEDGDADELNGFYFQLTEALIPNAPGVGSLYGPQELWVPQPATPQQAAPPRYTPRGSLYYSETMAAVLAGWTLRLPGDPRLGEDYEVIEQAIMSALDSRGLALKLYVTGDSTTSPGRSISPSLVLGRSVARVHADDPAPFAFTRDDALTGLSGLPNLDDAFWAEVAAKVPELEHDERPALTLACWGPLPRALLCFGASSTRAEHDPARGAFHANTSMEQEPSDIGVTGVVLERSEWDDLAPLDFGDAASETLNAKSPEGACYQLLARYD